MKSFRIYTLPKCPFCEQALALLKTTVPEALEHIDISDDPVAISGITALRGTIETPIIVVNIPNKKNKYLIIGNHLQELSSAITEYLNCPRS